MEDLFGKRLKLARKMAGMSLQDLADALNNQITKQALNKYEAGTMNPSNGILLAISKVLGVNPDYFLRKLEIEYTNVQFRKKQSLSQKEEDSIFENARDHFEKIIEIQNILGVESGFTNPLADLLIQDFADVELASIHLRSFWGLGKEPIYNVTETLELKSICVYLLNVADEFDGFASFMSNSMPYVVINRHNRPVERVRFTIIHELAHILLNLSDEIKKDLKLTEKICHYFASCFLLPSESLYSIIGSKKRNYIEIRELIRIKEYYGLSIRAIVYRLLQLEVISSSYYTRWQVYMSKTYGQKNEPGNFKGEEKTAAFENNVFRALAEDVISVSKAAHLLDVDLVSLRQKLSREY